MAAHIHTKYNIAYNIHIASSYGAVQQSVYFYCGHAIANSNLLQVY